MPPPVEQQLDLPVVEIVGEESIEFARLDMDDLMRWANDVRTKRIKDAEMRYAADPLLPAFERHRLIQALVDEGIQLGYLLNKAYEPEGIRKSLVMSLTKGDKMKPAEAVATLKRIHFRRQSAIATDVLSAPPAPPKTDKDGPPKSEEGFTEPEIGV